MGVVQRLRKLRERSIFYASGQDASHNVDAVRAAGEAAGREAVRSW